MSAVCPIMQDYAVSSSHCVVILDLPIVKVIHEGRKSKDKVLEGLCVCLQSVMSYEHYWKCQGQDQSMHFAMSSRRHDCAYMPLVLLIIIKFVQFLDLTAFQGQRSMTKVKDRGLSPCRQDCTYTLSVCLSSSFVQSQIRVLSTSWALLYLKVIYVKGQAKG